MNKTTNFIRDNIQKLTTLAFIPMITEEMMARVKGNKLAKSLLSKDLYKQVVKTNSLGAATYFILAAGSGLCAMLCIKVIDKIQAKYDLKQQQACN